MEAIIVRLIAAATLALLPAAVAAQERVIAKVNGKTITEADMRLAEAEVGSDLNSLPESARRRVLVEFLIENQLFASAAEGQKLDSGTAFDERMQYWRRRALRDAYFDRSVKDAVNPADARKFYDKQFSGPQAGEEVRARHILVETREKARDLFEKIAHGADFAQLAREHSKDPGSKDRGGDLGYFGRGSMVPQFEEAAFGTNKGEVAQPFETQFGWHILKVDDKRVRAAPAFDAVKDNIIGALIHEKAKEVAADLRNKAHIEYVDPDIKQSVDEEKRRPARK